MIAAIMQPYLLPYIGYFQLMCAADVFVFLDDVQYIDRGWVNRNRIGIDGRAAWLTMPVRKAGRTLAINQRSYLLDEATIGRATRRVASAYATAPHHEAALGLFREVLQGPDANVAAFNARQLQLVARALGIDCRFEWASGVAPPDGLRGQDRILDLCRRVGATHYVNAIGGMALYDPTTFDESGIRLSFLATRAPPATLAGDELHLSILDGLMHRGATGVAEQLPLYDLVAPA